MENKDEYRAIGKEKQMTRKIYQRNGRPCVKINGVFKPLPTGYQNFNGKAIIRVSKRYIRQDGVARVETWHSVRSIFGYLVFVVESQAVESHTETLDTDEGAQVWAFYPATATEPSEVVWLMQTEIDQLESEELPF